MDERIKGIEKRVNHNKYSYLYGTYDSNNNADDDIDYLLSRVKELEDRLRLTNRFASRRGESSADSDLIPAMREDKDG